MWKLARPLHSPGASDSHHGFIVAAVTVKAVTQHFSPEGFKQVF